MCVVCVCVLLLFFQQQQKGFFQGFCLLFSDFSDTADEESVVKEPKLHPLYQGDLNSDFVFGISVCSVMYICPYVCDLVSMSLLLS